MDDIQPSIADQIRSHHAKCGAAAGEALTHALEAGKLLASVKAGTPHGDFLPWLKRHCPEISVRTAQLYMRLDANRDRIKCATSAHMGVKRAAQLLARPKPKDDTGTVRSGLIPPTGKVTMLEDGKGNFAFVVPSPTDGFYYVAQLLVDVLGEWGDVEGTKKPIRADYVEHCLQQRFNGTKPRYEREVWADLNGEPLPWRYNSMLYPSYDTYVRCELLGKGAA